MADNKKSLAVVKSDPGFWINILRQIRLIFRLIGDSRVNFFAKLLPIGSLIYFFLPEPIPVVDDVILMTIGTYIFFELCPEDVVEEHRAALWGESGGPQKSKDVK